MFRMNSVTLIGIQKGRLSVLSATRLLVGLFLGWASTVHARIAEGMYGMEMMFLCANGAQPVSSRVARIAGGTKGKV